MYSTAPPASSLAATSANDAIIARYPSSPMLARITRGSLNAAATTASALTRGSKALCRKA